MLNFNWGEEATAERISRPLLCCSGDVDAAAIGAGPAQLPPILMILFLIGKTMVNIMFETSIAIIHNTNTNIHTVKNNHVHYRKKATGHKRLIVKY